MAAVVLETQVHCLGCARKIRKSIKNLRGVESVVASPETGLVVVAGTADVEALRCRIEQKIRRPVTIVSGGGGGGNNSTAAQFSASYSSVDLSLRSSSPAVVCRHRKEEAACPVCLSELADGEAVRVLPECKHRFHADCINTWLRGGHSSCPMCRAEITSSSSS